MRMLQEGEIEPTVFLEDVRTYDGEPEAAPIRYAISSYGADYTVDGLVKRIKEKSMYVPTFQREFVWDLKDASRFIESLLLGLPIPSVFLAKEPDTGKLLVVDGQQRLLSLFYYYEGIWKPSEKAFALKGVDPSFDGRTYKELRTENKRQLDDSIIHVTIFKQDEPSNDESSIYQVFERLNSGGKKLTPQEIRSAVHHSSKMRGVLAELNKDKEWRDIYGDEDLRMRDQELILRALAFYYDADSYRSPLWSFLNAFMGSRRNMNDAETFRVKEVFRRAIHIIHDTIGYSAFRPIRALNAAVFDSIMVGVASRLDKGPIEDREAFISAHHSLISNQEFLDACGRGTAGEERVKLRLELAKAAFAGV